MTRKISVHRVSRMDEEVGIILLPGAPFFMSLNWALSDTVWEMPV